MMSLMNRQHVLCDSVGKSYSCARVLNQSRIFDDFFDDEIVEKTLNFTRVHGVTRDVTKLSYPG